jgi:hypothetical protein
VLVIEETSITLFQTWMIISNLSTTSYTAYEKAVSISTLRVKKPSNMDTKIHQNGKQREEQTAMVFTVTSMMLNLANYSKVLFITAKL